LVRDHLQEQPEALDDETKSHERNGGALPGKQGSLRRKQGPGICRVGHFWAPSTEVQTATVSRILHGDQGRPDREITQDR
jgi:hypothetical protein